MSTNITTSYFNNGNGNGCHKTHLPRSRSYNIQRLQSIDQDQLRLFSKLSSKYGISRERHVLLKFRLKASPSSSSSSSSSSSDPKSSSSWKKWLWGILLTVILPAVGHRGGFLVGLKGKIDRAIDTVEHVTEAVEEIAEEAEKIMEEIEEKLPGDSKIKKALDQFEDLAEKAAKEAKKADNTIHKMKEVEEEIEEALIKAHEANRK